MTRRCAVRHVAARTSRGRAGRCSPAGRGWHRRRGGTPASVRRLPPAPSARRSTTGRRRRGDAQPASDRCTVLRRAGDLLHGRRARRRSSTARTVERARLPRSRNHSPPTAETSAVQRRRSQATIAHHGPKRCTRAHVALRCRQMSAAVRRRSTELSMRAIMPPAALRCSGTSTPATGRAARPEPDRGRGSSEPRCDRAGRTSCSSTTASRTRPASVAARPAGPSATASEARTPASWRARRARATRLPHAAGVGSSARRQTCRRGSRAAASPSTLEATAGPAHRASGGCSGMVAGHGACPREPAVASSTIPAGNACVACGSDPSAGRSASRRAARLARRPAAIGARVAEPRHRVSSLPRRRARGSRSPSRYDRRTVETRVTGERQAR